MADYTNYTNKEMQAVTIAKQIKNGQVVTVGTGLPLIGASVAKRVYAPDCHIIVESGLMDCSPVEVPPQRRRFTVYGPLRLHLAEHSVRRI